jgi:hypothetical protein
MKTTEISHSIRDLIISTEQMAVRSEGVHISAVVKFMASSLQKQGGWDEEPLGTAAQLGRVWEVVVAEALAQSTFCDGGYIRPGELECEGLIGSPDGIRLIDGAVQEFKCTWKSSGGDILAKSPWYKWQIMSYCYMVETQRATLFVLFLNGEYKPPQPVVRAWELEFSAIEIVENWAAIKANAKVMAKKGKG